MKKVFTFLVGLMTLVVVGWAGWEVVNWYLTIIKTLDRQVAAAIIAASTTVIVSVVTIILAKHFENKRLIDKDIRDKKIIVYEKLMAYMFQLIGTKDKSKIQSADDFYMEFSPSFITWGSDELVRHWSDFRKVAAAGDAVATLATFERLLLSIRKDIGHKNKGIEQDHILLSTFINDLDRLNLKK